MSVLPNDFNWEVYLQLHPDLNQCCNEEDAKYHYINHGYSENRRYKKHIPLDFDWKTYICLHADLDPCCTEEQSLHHYINHGYSENRPYKNSDPLHYIPPYDTPSDISMFLSKEEIKYSEHSFLPMKDILQNVPRGTYNSKEKMNANFIMSCILIIDFHNGGGGTSFFIESILSKYKKVQTFLIARNFNNEIYFTINDDYELEQAYTTKEAIEFLSNHKHIIEKIFVNHTMSHSREFLQSLPSLGKNMTTITHDLSLLFQEPQIAFHHINNYIADESSHCPINSNIYDQIITQNIANLYLFNNYIEDKHKIVISPLPDFTHSKELIELSNTNIVVGIIGAISDVKGRIELEKIIKYYKNTNIHMVVFGSVNIDSFQNVYPYKDVDELNELLMTHRPNILIELSVWPETYSYTLTLAMLTQLPILYLKKNGYAVVEERLSKYNQAYPFLCLHDLDILIHSKKQNHLYTIKPVIYYNDFWDQYFITKKETITLEPSEEYGNNRLNRLKNGLQKYVYHLDNKNVVLITSKIHVSNKKFSYISNRSVYSPEERLFQTIETIFSIKKYIPNPYIVLFDNSTFTIHQYNFLNDHVDKFLNITHDDSLNFYTDEYEYKAFSDISHQLYFYKTFFKYVDPKSVQHFFKISGRYVINESFDYNNYDNESIVFKKNKEVTDRDYYYTCFYKLNPTILDEYFIMLQQLLDDKHLYENNVSDLEVILPKIFENKMTLMDHLGITQRIAVYKNNISHI